MPTEERKTMSTQPLEVPLHVIRRKSDGHVLEYRLTEDQAKDLQEEIKVSSGEETYVEIVTLQTTREQLEFMVENGHRAKEFKVTMNVVE